MWWYRKIISKGLNVQGNIYDNIEAYLDYKNKQLKIFEQEYENQFKDYRKENVDEKKIINEILSQLPIHQTKKQIKLDDL